MERGVQGGTQSRTGARSRAAAQGQRAGRGSPLVRALSRTYQYWFGAQAIMFQVLPLSWWVLRATGQGECGQPARTRCRSEGLSRCDSER